MHFLNKAKPVFFLQSHNPSHLIAVSCSVYLVCTYVRLQIEFHQTVFTVLQSPRQIYRKSKTKSDSDIYLSKELQNSKAKFA